MKRDYRLDHVRSIAIICVVINHAIEETYPVFDYSILDYSLQSKWFALSGWVIGRSFGVPLFFFLTGFLLLPRDYTDIKNVKKFYKHNLWPLLVAWEGWILLYQIFICIRDETVFSVGNYLKCALFLKHAGMPHTWYIPVIIGIYLFLPFVSNAIRTINRSILIKLTAVIYFYCFIVPGISMLVCPTSPETIFSSQLYLAYSGGVYGCYLILGYIFFTFRKEIDKLYSGILWGVVLLGSTTLISTVYIQLLLRNNGSQYTVGYEFFLIPVTATCAFIILYRAELRSGMQKVVMQVSLCAFGIYCIHEPILQYLDSVIDYEKHNSLLVLILLIVSFCCSFFMTMILSKIKYTKWLVLRK